MSRPRLRPPYDDDPPILGEPIPRAWRHPIRRTSEATQPERLVLLLDIWWRRWTLLGCPPAGVLTASRVPRRWRWRLATPDDLGPPDDEVRGVLIELWPDGLPDKRQTIEILPGSIPNPSARLICPSCGALDVQLICHHPLTRWLCRACSP